MYIYIYIHVWKLARRSRSCTGRRPVGDSIAMVVVTATTTIATATITITITTTIIITTTTTIAVTTVVLSLRPVRSGRRAPESRGGQTMVTTV